MTFFRGELGKTFEELSQGEKAVFSRQVTKQDVLQYMSLSGDLNPLYGDAAYAARTRYQTMVVPANMLAGFVMGAVATVLPGLGSLTHSHSYRLVKPPRVGDLVTAEMEVVSLRPQQRLVEIQYRLVDQHGAELLVGEMVVEPPQPLQPMVVHEYESF